MSVLLRAGDNGSWADRLDQCRAQLLQDEEFAHSQIIKLYGGMGSLNDVVLYQDGQPLISSNNEFNELRTQLFELCTQR
ncbi:hypothetical protein DBY65_005955 [Pseudomonas sp. RIT412]|nr:hypothetical protein DBP26_004710 [Pseudomonas sp. RIT 409]RAU55443.1 hypothetical protein DBY65_005955 [Pseudomonas sp. RIT 412]